MSADGSADLQYVLTVAREIGQSVDSYICVVTKSNVPVGTAAVVRKKIQAELDRRGLELEFNVASCSEF